MKRCSNCKIYKELTNFTRNAGCKDDLSPQCKKCRAEKKKKWSSMPKNRKRRNELKKIYSKLNPLKNSARWAVQNERKRGREHKPKCCFDCGKETTKLVADHYLGYEKEHWLDIQFICTSCDGIRRSKLLIRKNQRMFKCCKRGCSKMAHSKRMCSMHYARQRKK